MTIPTLPRLKLRLVFNPTTNFLTSVDVEGDFTPECLDVCQDIENPGDVTIYFNEPDNTGDSFHKNLVPIGDEACSGGFKPGVLQFLQRIPSYQYGGAKSMLGLDTAFKIAKDFEVNTLTKPEASSTLTVVEFSGTPRDKFDLKEVTSTLSIYMRGSPTREYIAKVLAKAAKGELTRVRCSYHSAAKSIYEELTKCGFKDVKYLSETVEVPDLDVAPKQSGVWEVVFSGEFLNTSSKDSFVQTLNQYASPAFTDLHCWRLADIVDCNGVTAKIRVLVKSNAQIILDKAHECGLKAEIVPSAADFNYNEYRNDLKTVVKFRRTVATYNGWIGEHGAVLRTESRTHSTEALAHYAVVASMSKVVETNCHSEKGAERLARHLNANGFVATCHYNIKK